MTDTFSRALALALALALAAVGAPALAKDKKPVDPNKKLCRSETPTGSRFVKSTCHTAAEWAAIDEANASSAQSLGRTPVTGTSGN